MKEWLPGKGYKPFFGVSRDRRVIGTGWLRDLRSPWQRFKDWLRFRAR